MDTESPEILKPDTVLCQGDWIRQDGDIGLVAFVAWARIAVIWIKHGGAGTEPERELGELQHVTRDGVICVGVRTDALFDADVIEGGIERLEPLAALDYLAQEYQ